jgi:uncharacterized membrane protein YfcA
MLECSIGQGVVLLYINSIFLALIRQFFIGGIPWELAIFTGFGCVFGARIGSSLSQWIGQVRLKAELASVATIDGLIFAFQFLLSGLK